jgi:hypothetical protein
MGKESWAKYGMKKAKGTAIKSGAYIEAKEEGFMTAISAPPGPAGEQILKNAVEGMWSEARKLTKEARKISGTVNNQRSKAEREVALDRAREAARKAGLHAAIAAGWEQGWKEGILKRDSKKSD